MRLLDLFCGAGGAAMGYHQAGFTEIVGVDIVRQPRYPFTFMQADALAYLEKYGEEFDVIHASPPCQAFTQMSARWRGRGTKADTHTDLLTPIRCSLVARAQPYIIENVVGARKHMATTCILHGGMFDLQVSRPRLFESNYLLWTMTAPIPKPCIGVYGDHPQRYTTTRKNGAGNGRSVFLRAKSLEEARQVMGIPWGTWNEIREAIPPAYTQWIGSQLLQHLRPVPISPDAAPRPAGPPEPAGWERKEA